MKIQFLTGIVAVALLVSPALARRGADDGPGHVRQCRGCEHAPGHSSILSPDTVIEVARRGRGADDGPGHQRRCRGCDDGPNHT
jgi:hypothetical protein